MMDAPLLDESKLHELRVNSLLQAFVTQRDTALSNVATLTGDKAVLEARNQALVLYINKLSIENASLKEAAEKSAKESAELSELLETVSNERQALLTELALLRTDYENLQAEKD